MSDALNRAVDAHIDAYRPESVPPFADIEARKRVRDRRRLAAGGSLLSAVAVAGAVMFVQSSDEGGDQLTSETGQVAGLLFVQEDLPADATVVGTTRAVGALIDAADPAYLILSVDGASEVAQDDPCWEGYRASVTADGPTIEVKVERLRRVAANVGRGCLGVGATRAVGVRTGSPVAERQVQDASSGATIRPFDGARLLRPTHLPPGYRETGQPGVGADGAWLRFYSGPSGTSPITVKQEAGERLAPPEPGATVESRPTVDGRPATIYTVTGQERVVRRTLQWADDGQTLTVGSSQSAPSAGPASSDTMLRVAQGLQRES